VYIFLLQTSRSIKIPKDHHRFLLGPKGKRLSELQLLTATKISVPRQDELSDVITVSGTRDGIEKAVHEIQLISDEQVIQLLNSLLKYMPFMHHIIAAKLCTFLTVTTYQLCCILMYSLSCYSKTLL